MQLPQIAIVGRPNVGKSSLLNRLARKRVSIVDPTPGITRDRVTTVVEIEPPLETAKGTPVAVAELMDTGGYGVYTAEGGRFDDVGADLSHLTRDIEFQIGVAVKNADVIVFVVDAQIGVTPLDEAVAQLLRKSGKATSVILAANKVDSEDWLDHLGEMHSLGFGEPVGLSAENGYHIRDLTDQLYERVWYSTEDSSHTDDEKKPEFTFAIIGKRNSGKSTLINALAGEPRVIVSEIAGTTRDSVDVRFETEGHTMVAIDTAGLRKRKSMKEDVEYYALQRALGAIRRADVCMLMIDATEEISQVEKQLSQELQKQFKPTIIVVNKWDLVDPGTTSESYLDYLTQELRGLDYAPLVFISAKTGEGIKDLIAMALNLFEQANHREPTAKLNAAIEDILALRGPTSRLGTQAKVYYVSQVAVNPPTIVLVVNQPKLFEGQYERYLMNRLREVVPFSEVPIRLLFRGRKRMSVPEMKARGRERAAASSEFEFDFEVEGEFNNEDTEHRG